MEFIREEKCTGCGEMVKIYKAKIVGGPHKGEWSKLKIGCKCEDRKLAREAVKNAKRVKKERITERFQKYSLINPDLRSATFYDYIPQNKSQKWAQEVTIRYTKDFDQYRNLIFSGNYGVGKSHLAKAVTDGVINRGFSAIFITVPRLLTVYRQSFRKDSAIDQEDLDKAIAMADLIVLDDIGSEHGTQWVDDKMFEIIDERQGKSTIYTTNLSIDELKSLYGERIGSRIVNNDAITVDISGENYREKGRKIRKNERKESAND
jgi:DNA replication protein DnaC